MIGAALNKPADFCIERAYGERSDKDRGAAHRGTAGAERVAHPPSGAATETTAL
jgi:hypothetical protein